MHRFWRLVIPESSFAVATDSTLLASASKVMTIDEKTLSRILQETIQQMPARQLFQPKIRPSRKKKTLLPPIHEETSSG